MKAKYIAALFSSLILSSATNAATAYGSAGADGFPLANFAVTANVAASGDLVGKVLRNPGQLGQWLADMGSFPLSVRTDVGSHPFSGFTDVRVERTFPFVRAEYGRSPLTGATVAATLFCPLAINDVGIASLPVVMIDLAISAGQGDENFALLISPDQAAGMAAVGGDGFWGMAADCCMVAADCEAAATDGGLEVGVALRPGETQRIRLIVAFHDDEWLTAADFPTLTELASHVFRSWDDLRARTEAFDRALPATGDAELDAYLRWYIIPAVSLTKCTRSGDIINMGYCELNQRDSYWTSWLHLVMFRDAERRIIQESIDAVRPDGKMPTTILPLIEREDDIDINAFLLLRASRYYRLYHSRQDLAAWWPALKRAMEWLIARDTSGRGLPMQVSFWGDWKDVKGVEGRLYSPFSGLIYLAALRQMQQLAAVVADSEAIDRYAEAYRRGYDFINKPTSEGGLWNGRYYCQVWRDGSVSDRLLQDQTIGILFGVVPAERSNSIVEALNATNLTPYGVCETYPYYPDSFGYKAGTYHNGGVWPWVSFMDDWGRLRLGRRQEAIDLVKRVARADLVDSGDWAPNEHIDSQTGENLGFLLQGWNSALFGFVYFGLLHPGIVID